MTIFKRNQRNLPRMLFCLFKFIAVMNGLGFSLADNVRVTFVHLDMDDYGPVLRINCEYDTPLGGTNYVVQWLFNGKRIPIENTQMISADFSRYLLSDNKLTLWIRNIVKEDEGLYTCQVQYNIGSDAKSYTGDEYVTVDRYLPSLNYPKCSLDPNISLSVGTYVTFNCTVGESSDPGVSLQLMLTGPSGPLKEYSMHSPTPQRSTVSLPKNITIEDANAVFICNMTSATFPLVSRRCSVGPITLESQTTISAPLSSTNVGLTSTNGVELHETYSTMNATSTLEPEKGNTIAQEVIISVVVIILIIIIIAITLIVVTFCKSHRANKANVKAHGAHHSGNNMEQETHIDDVHYKQIIDGKSPNDNASSASVVKTSDRSPSEIKPVYTAVYKTNKPATELSSQNGNADEMPVYGKVDKSQGGTNRESSGFVDNSLYVPSGPY